MIRKKNGFFTFLCSLFPGAGEMYLGFMKEGVSIMGAAFLLILCSTWLHLDNFLILFPLVWFYSFFNVHNKAGLPDEEFYALEDDYLFHLDRILPEGTRRLDMNQTLVLGWILVLLGISAVWNPSVNLAMKLVERLVSMEAYYLIRDFFYDIPQYLIAFVLIYEGVKLIGDRKKNQNL